MEQLLRQCALECYSGLTRGPDDDLYDVDFGTPEVNPEAYRYRHFTANDIGSDMGALQDLYLKLLPGMAEKLREHKVVPGEVVLRAIRYPSGACNFGHHFDISYLTQNIGSVDEAGNVFLPKREEFWYGTMATRMHGVEPVLHSFNTRGGVRTTFVLFGLPRFNTRLNHYKTTPHRTVGELLTHLGEQRVQRQKPIEAPMKDFANRTIRSWQYGQGAGL